MVHGFAIHHAGKGLQAPIGVNGYENVPMLARGEFDSEHKGCGRGLGHEASPSRGISTCPTAKSSFIG